MTPDTSPSPAPSAPPTARQTRERISQTIRPVRFAIPALVLFALQPLLFPIPAGAWLQGIVLGLLDMLVALGVALVWRANRVLNFAQADLGTFPAALGVGIIILSGANYFVGLAAGLLASVVVGALAELVVIRRFRTAPRLILTVATIGISQFFVVAALLVPRLWGVNVLVAEGGGTDYQFPWRFSTTIGGQVFHADDLVAALVSILCVTAVVVFLQRSATGTAIRAAADRSDRASMLGIPVARMELVVWTTASVLSFLGVFFRGAILGFPLNATVGIVTLVTALAALALGGFDDLRAILGSAVALGVIEKAVAWNNPTRPTFFYAVLGVLVLVAMLVRRGRRNRPGSVETSTWQASVEPLPVPLRLRSHPALRATTVALLALCAVVAATLPLLLNESRTFAATNLVAISLVVVSVVVLTGWAGEITLGQMGFAGVGAAFAAVATLTWQWDLSLILPTAGVAAAVVALVVGLPSLRFRGLLPAATTLAFALAATGYFLNSNQQTWLRTDRIERRPIFGLWRLTGTTAMYECALVVLALCLLGLRGIHRSHLGRSLRAVRDGDQAAASFGVSPVGAKLTAYAISGFLAGVGGALLAYANNGFDPSAYAPTESLTVFTAAVVGGVGSVIGGILGALYLDGARWLLTGYWQLLPTAVGVLVVLLFLPGGFGGLVYRVRDAFLRRVGGARDVFGDPAQLDDSTADMRDHGAGAAPRGPSRSTRVMPAGETPAPALLSLRGVEVAFDGATVLDGIDLDVHEGEIVALLGTNGAGKSTLLRAICGIQAMESGSVRFAGDEIVGRSPESIARGGISQMPGGQGTFPSLTVDENLRMATWMFRHDAADAAARLQEVRDLFPVLAQRGPEAAHALSGGQQQILALAMSLITRPRLLLIDELSMGLAPVVVDQLVAKVREIHASGTTVIIVEQSVTLALTCAERAFFLEKGEVRFEGPTAELLERPDLLRSVYLQEAARGLDAQQDVDLRSASSDSAGTPSRAQRGAGPTKAATPALCVQDASIHFGGVAALDRVSFEVAPQEILGIVGPNGAGKTTLFDVVSGFLPDARGNVQLDGRHVAHNGAAARARAGLGRSFQDSHLFGALTVHETVSVALAHSIRGADPVSAAFRLPARQVVEAGVHARTEELLALLGLGWLQDRRIRELSTGQRRLVDLACVLAHRPDVVLLDEPSSGVAQREVEALAPLITRIRDELGAAVLVIDHDLALLTAVSDRLLALDQGRRITEGPPDEVLAHPHVVASYLGTSAGSAGHTSLTLTSAPRPEGVPPR